MEEIVIDDDLKSLNDNDARQQDNSKVEIVVRTIGPSRPSGLLVPSPIPCSFSHSNSLIVAVKPEPPSKNLGGLDDDDDDDEELKFQLPQSSSRWKRKLYFFLHDKLKLPDLLLMAIFYLSLKWWVIIIMWFILAPVANRFDLGPLYILGTGFVIILVNLGKRKPGDVSAYSIFNENFQELPGTLKQIVWIGTLGQVNFELSTPLPSIWCARFSGVFFGRYWNFVSFLIPKAVQILPVQYGHFV